MVGFYRELCDQLTVNCYDNLADPVAEAADRCRDLISLVVARLGEEMDAIMLRKFIDTDFTHAGDVAN